TITSSTCSLCNPLAPVSESKEILHSLTGSKFPRARFVIFIAGLKKSYHTNEDAVVPVERLVPLTLIVDGVVRADDKPAFRFSNNCVCSTRRFLPANKYGK